MKRFIFCALFLTLLMAAFCICASAEVYEGRALDEAYILGWGEGEAPEGWDEAYELAAYYQVQYRLDTDTGELRIFCGEKKPQKMLPYADGNWVPWTKDHMRPYIKTVIIEEGILSVGRFSFDHCENLETVYIPSSVLRVDQTCFYECPRLKTIYYAGTEKDFNEYVEYQDVRNSYTGGLTERKALDLFVFGESITVLCKNQDGEVFRSYIVGGYHAGDAYTVTAQTFEGLTLDSKKTTVTGKFKKGDTKQIVFEYTCNHEYQITDETKPCSSFCIWCECSDPAVDGDHEWNVKADVPRGLFTDRLLDKECTICGATKHESAIAYIWYVGAGAAILVIVAGVACAIAIPIRRKRKMKDMTW
ncbi:MAG: leucine-rich repeat protein [Clostridia bacterium]|nr:leucine-rich repeat protein [Clostridia bacterium]